MLIDFHIIQKNINKQKQDQVNCENPHWEKFISEKYSPKKIFTLKNIHPKKYSPQKY